MGLGSADEKRRKEIKSVLPKNDWKAKVRGSAQARETYEIILAQLAKTSDGKYLIDAYAGQKLRQLEAYERYCILREDMEQQVLSLREYINEIKHEYKE